MKLRRHNVIVSHFNERLSTIFVAAMHFHTKEQSRFNYLFLFFMYILTLILGRIAATAFALFLTVGGKER